MKRGKHPTTSRRKKRQRTKERLAKAIHDAQMENVIPMQPAGVLRNERVDPSTQNEPALPSLVAMAARNGWATPAEKKPLIVDELVEIATGCGIEIGPDGINAGPSAKTKVYAAKVLAEIDQIQYERDHPEEAGKAKGATKVAVGVAVNNVPVTDIGDLIRRAREQREAGRDQGENNQRIEGPKDAAAEEQRGAPGDVREGDSEVPRERSSEEEHPAGDGTGGGEVVG